MADDVASSQRDPRLVLADVVWDTPGRAEVKATVAALLRYTDSSWRTFTSVPRLAELAGLDVKTVRDRLDLLQRAGGVSRRDRYNEKGGMTSAEWTIAPHRIAHAITEASAARVKRAPPTPLPSTEGGGPYRQREGAPTVYGTGALPSTEGPPLPSTDDDPGILIRGSDPGNGSGEITGCEDDPTDTRKADPRSDLDTDPTLTDTNEDSPMQLFGKEILHPADTRIAEATPPKAPPLPSWVPKDTRPYARADVAGMVLAIVAEHRRPADLAADEPTPEIAGDVRCKGDAKTVLALWSYLERPPLGEFAADVIAVIRAAQPGGCPHRKFARDIRAEGWPEGTDRHRDLDSVLRHARWADRLEMAREWSANPTAYAAALPAVRPARGEYRSIADLVAEASAIPDPANPPRPNRDAIDVAYRVVT